MAAGGDIAARKDEVKRRLKIGDVVEGHVKLSGSTSAVNRRGKCPFHQGNSPSFSVKRGDQADGFGHCFGCGWHGDVFRFTMDMFGLSFMDALEECERLAGIAAAAPRYSAARPVQRERSPAPARDRRREMIEPIEMGRWIWRKARPDPAAVTRYFLGRGVPERALLPERLTEFRYLGECPCVLWDRSASPRGLPPKNILVAPAIMALVRVPTLLEGGQLEWIPTGVHVTYLNPTGEGTMIRRKPWAKPGDEDPMLPKRRMLGAVKHGCVMLGAYRRDAHLWIGEGNETVLSAMGLAGGAPEAVGLAVLSLDNLQGQPAKWRSNVWPLHRIQPDPGSLPFLVPGHAGAVTGLIDSDMSPLRGTIDPKTGEVGELVVERKGGPIVRRAITGAERARICAELFVKAWRATGARSVEAMRAPAGMDFNDAARAAMGEAA